MSDHKADAEALARVQRYVDALAVVDGSHFVTSTLAHFTLADLRRVVNLADRTADAR